MCFSSLHGARKKWLANFARGITRCSLPEAGRTPLSHPSCVNVAVTQRLSAPFWTLLTMSTVLEGPKPKHWDGLRNATAACPKRLQLQPTAPHVPTGTQDKDSGRGHQHRRVSLVFVFHSPSAAGDEEQIPLDGEQGESQETGGRLVSFKSAPACPAGKRAWTLVPAERLCGVGTCHGTVQRG